MFIQRQKLKPKVEPVTPTKSLPRVVTQNNATERAAKNAEARASLDHFLNLVAENDKQIDDAVARNDAVYAMIEKLLRDNNMTEHTDGVYITQIAEQFSRQSRTIDPKKFKNHVGSEEFWKAITVSIEAAKTLMTDLELNAISDIVPSKSMGHIFKIRKAERKSRK